MKIEVSVPLNISCYLEANGFHPIYQSLLLQHDKMIFNVPDMMSAQNLIRTEPKRIKELNQEIVSNKYQYLGATNVVRKYVDYYYADEGFLLSETPGDFEFSHTIPLSSGTRPWVFHCETLMPIFMPFMVEGGGSAWNTDLHQMYLKIFEDPDLIFIGSHLEATLQNFRDVFESDIINNKLVKTSISIPNTPQQNKSRVREIDFLFVCSFHQNINNFKYRGGFGVIRFAIDYLNQYESGKVVFRTPKPNDEEMENNGVDVQKLNFLLSKGKLVWLEQMVSSEALQRLFQKTKFFLLPSTNLHSASLMQALKSGCVPVVSDATGVEEFISDKINGIQLSGLVERTIINFGASEISAVNYEKLDSTYTESIEKKLKHFFQDKNQYELSEFYQTFKSSSQSFEPEGFIGDIYNELNKRGLDLLLPSKIKSNILKTIPVDKKGRLFTSSPQPRIMFWGEKAAIFEMSGINYFILHSEIPKTILGWRLGVNKYLMSAEYQSLLSGSECLELLVSGGKKLSFFKYKRIEIIYKLRKYLKKYPLIFNLLSTSRIIIFLDKKLG